MRKYAIGVRCHEGKIEVYDVIEIDFEHASEKADAIRFSLSPGDWRIVFIEEKAF